MSLRTMVPLALTFPFLLAACGGEPEEEVKELEQPFTSDVATLMDFEFDGELASASIANTRALIKAQLLFSVGSINAEPGVARLERATLTNITTASLGGGLYRVRYHAKVPVAWGHKSDLPSSYQFTLPRRVDSAGQSTFTARYGATCNDGEASDVNAGNFWYHYRPAASGCVLAPTDVFTTRATVRVATQNSVASYPEYHKIWQDGALTVLAVFGKYEEGATSPSDAGIAAYNAFVAGMRTGYPDAASKTSSVTGMTETSFVREREGAALRVVALLVDGVRVAPAAFDKRYAELSPGADVIIYNGHAGLGANVRSLATKGKFFPGKYQILFLNGCDTFAYIDDTLAKTRALLNTDDAAGTKYMDTIANAMPAYFVDMGPGSLGLIKSLMNPQQPDTFARIFRAVDPIQVVVAVGEEDNVFHAAYDPGTNWAGMTAAGAVGYRETQSYSTDTLPAGTYVFTLTPDVAVAGGDADARIRVGAAPTLTTTYRCKSYVANSNERCVVKLTAPAKVYLTVTGDTSGSSRYRLDGFEDPGAR